MSLYNQDKMPPGGAAPRASTGSQSEARTHSHGGCRHVRELVLVEERARVRHLAQPRLDGGQALLSHDDSMVARGSESSSATFLTGSVRPHGSALERAALHAMQSSSGMMYVSTILPRHGRPAELSSLTKRTAHRSGLMTLPSAHLAGRVAAETMNVPDCITKAVFDVGDPIACPCAPSATASLIRRQETVGQL